MPILYSVICRGPTILAKYAECVGNFAEVTEQIIPKIKLEDHKLTYSHGNYLIHYICENRIIYMCISDDVSKFATNLCSHLKTIKCLPPQTGLRTVAGVPVSHGNQEKVYPNVRAHGGDGHRVRHEYGIFADVGPRDEALQRVTGGGCH